MTSVNKYGNKILVKCSSTCIPQVLYLLSLLPLNSGSIHIKYITCDDATYRYARILCELDREASSFSISLSVRPVHEAIPLEASYIELLEAMVVRVDGIHD